MSHFLNGKQCIVALRDLDGTDTYKQIQATIIDVVHKQSEYKDYKGDKARNVYIIQYMYPNRITHQNEVHITEIDLCQLIQVLEIYNKQN